MDKASLLAHKVRNNLQSLGLVAALALLLGYLAWVLGGASFFWGAVFAVLLLYITNPAGSPRLVLAMYGARPIGVAEAPKLHAIENALAGRAGLSKAPALYYVPSPALNAFATGSRDDAVIALSDGLLRQLNLRELTAVLAHELSHVANGDTRVMAFADLVSRITALLSGAGQLLLFFSIPLFLLGAALPPLMPMLVLLFAPTLSALVQLALSRNREFEADRSAVELSGDPEGLASALAKLERQQGSLWEQLVMPGRRIPEPSILRTHPPTEERIRRLMALSPQHVEIHEDLPWSRDVPASALDWSASPVHRRPRWRASSGLWY